TVFDQQLERPAQGAFFFGLANEHFWFVQTVSNVPGNKRRNNADEEHATPADVRQQQGSQKRRTQNPRLNRSDTYSESAEKRDGLSDDGIYDSQKTNPQKHEPDVSVAQPEPDKCCNDA